MYGVFRSKPVQGYLINKILSNVTEELRTQIVIGGIDVDPFSSLILENIYVQDHFQDTLLFAKGISVDFEELSFIGKHLNIRTLVVDQALLKLIAYEGEKQNNLKVFLNYFSNQDSSQTKWGLDLHSIEFLQSRFSYFNQNNQVQKTGIDFNDLNVSDIEGRVNNFSIAGDSIKGKLMKFSFWEKSGLNFKHLTADIYGSSSKLILDSLNIETNSSKIQSYISFDYSSYNDFLFFPDSVKMHADIINSYFSLDDLAFFMPTIGGINYGFRLSTVLDGNLANMKAKYFSVHFGNRGLIKGDFSLRGLPNLQETFMHLKLKELFLTQSDLREIPIPPFETGNNLKLPKVIQNLGQISYQGHFTGFYNDFVAYGKFETDLGKLSSDLKLKEDTLNNQIKYKGSLSSNSFSTGAFLGFNTIVGNSSFNIDVDGEGIDRENVDVNITGLVDGLEVNGYYYKNINLSGGFTENRFIGLVEVKDENVDLSFNGEIDFFENKPIFDFNALINRADLYKLNINKRDSLSILHCELNSNFSGDDLDDVAGSLILKNIKYEHLHENSISVDNIGDVLLYAVNRRNSRHMEIRSSMIDLQLDGTFFIDDMLGSFRSIANNLVPSSRIHVDRRSSNQRKQNFKSKIQIKNIDPLVDLANVDLSIAENSHLNIWYSTNDTSLYVDGYSDKLRFGNKVLNNFSFNMAIDSNRIDEKDNMLKSSLEMLVNVNSKSLSFSDSSTMDSILIELKIQNDQIKYHSHWGNRNQTDFAGDVKGVLSFNSIVEKLKTENSIDKPSFKWMQISFAESKIILADSVWVISDKSIIDIDTNYIGVNDFQIYSGLKKLLINGYSTPNKSNGINVSLGGFDLSFFNRFNKKRKIQWEGMLEAEFVVANVFTEPFITGNCRIHDLKLNRQEFGDVVLESNWDRETDQVSLKGSLDNEDHRSINIYGGYSLSRNSDNKDSLGMNLGIELNNFKPYILQPLVASLFSEISKRTTISGKLNLLGEINKLELLGNLAIHKGGCRLGYTNVFYNFADNINFKNDGIYLEDIIVNDLKGNRALVNGGIYHSNFKNFKFDLQFSPDNLHSLNTTEEKNSSYYGQGFASGTFRVTGTPAQLFLESNITTNKGTQIFIPLLDANEASTGGFVTFVNPEKNKEKSNDEFGQINITKLPEINFDLDITQDASVQLIFDQTVGDILKAKGNGALKLRIDHTGEYNMYGTYTIDKGDYLFTLQKVINKRFRIEEGGSIKWNGDPYNAVLDINAVYSLNASLADLYVGNEEQELGNFDSKRRIPVDCKLYVKGNLMNPDIAFDITFPNMDLGSQATLANLWTTEQQLNKQIFSLLVLGRFQPLLGFKETSGLVSTNSSELLSNQLSNWLSKINEDFDIGINYRSSNDSIADIEVALSTQLFDDRLSINGSLANKPNDLSQTSSKIVGDFDINYKVTKDGKLRVKAYNHSNEAYLTTDNAPYTQGLGLFYMKEFNSLNELFRKNNKSKN